MFIWNKRWQSRETTLHLESIAPPSSWITKHCHFYQYVSHIGFYLKVHCWLTVYWRTVQTWYICCLRCLYAVRNRTLLWVLMLIDLRWFNDAEMCWSWQDCRLDWRNLDLILVRFASCLDEFLHGYPECWGSNTAPASCKQATISRFFCLRRGFHKTVLSI